MMILFVSEVEKLKTNLEMAECTEAKQNHEAFQ